METTVVQGAGAGRAGTVERGTVLACLLVEAGVWRMVALVIRSVNMVPRDTGKGREAQAHISTRTATSRCTTRTSNSSSSSSTSSRSSNSSNTSSSTSSLTRSSRPAGGREGKAGKAGRAGRRGRGGRDTARGSIGTSRGTTTGEDSPPLRC